MAHSGWVPGLSASFCAAMDWSRRCASSSGRSCTRARRARVAPSTCSSSSTRSRRHAIGRVSDTAGGARPTPPPHPAPPSATQVLRASLRGRPRVLRHHRLRDAVRADADGAQALVGRRDGVALDQALGASRDANSAREGSPRPLVSPCFARPPQVLRCSGCFTRQQSLDRQFCSKCGNASLVRLQMAINAEVRTRLRHSKQAAHGPRDVSSLSPLLSRYRATSASCRKGRRRRASARPTSAAPSLRCRRRRAGATPRI